MSIYIACYLGSLYRIGIEFPVKHPVRHSILTAKMEAFPTPLLAIIGLFCR